MHRVKENSKKDKALDKKRGVTERPAKKPVQKPTIAIKKKNQGLLHKNLGVAKGGKIPVSKLKSAKNSKSPAVRKRATFALNARKWNHQ